MKGPLPSRDCHHMLCVHAVVFSRSCCGLPMTLGRTLLLRVTWPTTYVPACVQHM